MKSFKKQLKQMAVSHDLVNPDQLWVLENKKRLILQIGNMVGNHHKTSPFYAFKQCIKTFVPSEVLRVLRPMCTSVMVLALAIAGWGASVSASFNSLPGDVLWNVKVAAEKTQIAFSGSKEEKIKKQLEFAERRVDEVRTVFKNDNNKSTDKHRSAAKEELKKVKESVADMVKSGDEAVRDTVKTDPDYAMKLALVLENKAGNIATGLDELQEVANKTGDKELVAQVKEASKQTNETAYIPLESVLEASVQPAVAENKKIQDEVRQLVADKLDGVLEDTQKIQQQAQQGSEADTVTSTAISAPENSSSTVPAVVIPLSIISSSTASDTESDPKNTADLKTEVVHPSVSADTLNQVTEKTRSVEESAKEVRGLIKEGKLNEALDKIKTMDQITTDAKAIL